jgi:hypothetical protein
VPPPPEPRFRSACAASLRTRDPRASPCPAFDARMLPCAPRCSCSGTAAHRSRRLHRLSGLPEAAARVVSAESCRCRPPRAVIRASERRSSSDGEARVQEASLPALVARRRGHILRRSPCGVSDGRLDEGVALGEVAAGLQITPRERPTAPASAGHSTKRHREIRSWDDARPRSSRLVDPAVLPWGLLPYDVSDHGQRLVPGLPPPATRRLQVFSTS